MKMTRQQLQKLVREVNYLENRGFQDEDFLDEIVADRLEDICQMIADYQNEPY